MQQRYTQQWPSHNLLKAKQVSKKAEEAIIIGNFSTVTTTYKIKCALLPPDLSGVLCIASNSHFTVTQYVGFSGSSRSRSNLIIQESQQSANENWSFQPQWLQRNIVKCWYLG